MRIIGIDPGLARVGYGIIEVQNEKKITDYIVDDLSEKILNKINLKINDS